MSLKTEVAPKGMSFKPTEFMMGNKYCTIMTVISFPKSIPMGYLSYVTSMTGIKVVVKHIPMRFDAVQKMLNKEIVELKSAYQTEKDNTMQERIRQNYETIESFVSMLAATVIDGIGEPTLFSIS